MCLFIIIFILYNIISTGGAKIEEKQGNGSEGEDKMDELL